MKHVETNPDGRVLTLTPEGARQVAADWAAATRPPEQADPVPPPRRRRWRLFRRR